MRFGLRGTRGGAPRHGATDAVRPLRIARRAGAVGTAMPTGLRISVRSRRLSAISSDQERAGGAPARSSGAAPRPPERGGWRLYPQLSVGENLTNHGTGTWPGRISRMVRVVDIASTGGGGCREGQGVLRREGEPRPDQRRPPRRGARASGEPGCGSASTERRSSRRPVVAGKAREPFVRRPLGALRRPRGASFRERWNALDAPAP